MIRPPSRRREIAAWATKNEPLTFTAMSSSKISSDVVSTVPSLPIPALLTRMSNWLLAASLGQFGVEGLEELTDPGHGAHVALDGEGFPAGRFDLADHGGRGLGVFLEVHGHHCPVLGQAHGNGPPDTSAGPGDDGDLSLQAHVFVLR